MSAGRSILAGTWGGGAFLSTDHGANWTAVNTGLKGTYVYCLAASGMHLYAGTDSGAFHSTNHGASWTSITAGLTDTMMYRAVYAFAVNGTDLFAGTNNGVFLSTDNGACWTAANAGLPDEFAASALAVSGTDLFAGSQWTHGGIFHSTDRGSSWTTVTTGAQDSYIYSFGANGPDLFTGGGFGRVYRSTDNGTNWVAVNTGLMTASVSALAVSGTNLFAGGSGGGTFRSTNNGTTWSTLNAGPSDIMTYCAVSDLAVSNAALFAGTDSGVFRSTNNGDELDCRQHGADGKVHRISCPQWYDPLRRNLWRRSFPLHQRWHKLDCGQCGIDGFHCLSSCCQRHTSLCGDKQLLAGPAAFAIRPTMVQTGVKSAIRGQSSESQILRSADPVSSPRPGATVSSVPPTMVRPGPLSTRDRQTTTAVSMYTPLP